MTLNFTLGEYEFVTDNSGGQRIELQHQPDGEVAAHIDGGKLNGLVPVRTADDLPDASGGVRTLEDNTAYYFTGFVADSATLHLGDPSPLLAPHGSVGGYIHTGGSAALESDGEAFMARNVYVSAPFGTLFDLSADNTTEMLVESCGFSDAAGLGNIASLGTIDGYRVPTFKGCNFEDFDGGLTFDGNPDKIFVWGSPVRNITASDVDIFTLASTCNAQIVDFADNYVKDVQSDTAVWHVESGGEPSEVFQYRGTVHDTSFDKANALTGVADAQSEPYWVSDSHPLRESNVVGELSLDGSTVTTINAQNTWYQVAGATTLGNESERVSQASAGQLQYNGTKNSNVHITVSASMYGANGSIYRIAIAKNGSIEPATTMKIEAAGQNANVSVSTSSIEDVTNGDTISLQVQNTSGTGNATFAAYTINFLGS